MYLSIFLSSQAGSLLACASSTDSRSLHGTSITSQQAYRESVDTVLETEKHLLAMRRSTSNPAPAWCGPDGTEEIEVKPATEGIVISHRDAEHGGGPRRETDGGVRLAGGRAGEVTAEEFDRNRMSEGSTLPPEYCSEFGDS